MKKLVSVISAGLLVFALFGCSKKVEKGEFTVQKGKFLVAMEIGYPPMEYYAEDGKTPIGFDIELSKEIAKRIGLEVEFIDTAWDGIFAGLNTNRYDAVISAVTITDDRKNNFDLSQPYVGNGQAIIVRKDSPLEIKKFSDLAGLKVGYQAETTSDFYTKKHAAAENFTYIENGYDKIMNAYDDLRLKRIDAVVSDTVVSVDYLAPVDTVFKAAWLSDPDEFLGVCVKKGNTVLLDKVNAALSDMKEDGTMKSLFEKIFGMDLSDTTK